MSYLYEDLVNDKEVQSPSTSFLFEIGGLRVYFRYLTLSTTFYSI